MLQHTPVLLHKLLEPTDKTISPVYIGQQLNIKTHCVGPHRYYQNSSDPTRHGLTAEQQKPIKR